MRYAHYVSSLLVVVFGGAPSAHGQPPSSTEPPPTTIAPSKPEPTRSSLVEDFTGSWLLDLKRSDSPEAIMEAVGAPWPLRKVVPHIAVSQHIVQRNDRMSIEVENPVMTRDMELFLDGRTSRIPAFTPGEEVEATVTVLDGGRAVMSTTVVKLQEGGTGVMTVKRWLEGRNTMRIELKLQKESGTLVAQRYFRRTEDKIQAQDPPR